MSKEQVEFYQKAAAEGKQVFGRAAAKASAQALAGDSSGGARGGIAGASGRLGKPKGKKGGAKGVDYTAMVVSEAEAQLAQRLANGRGGRGSALRVLPARRADGRAGQPEEVANAIYWLLTDKASYVAGANMDVSGGRV